MTESTTMTDSITSRSDAETEMAVPGTADPEVAETKAAETESAETGSAETEAAGTAAGAESAETELVGTQPTDDPGPDAVDAVDATVAPQADIDHALDSEDGEGSGGDDASTEGNGGTDEDPARRRAPRGTRVSLLEREGEVAADFLERLLDIADLDGDIEVDIDGDRAAVAIVDSEEGRVPRRLVGAQGKVLDALQELTRLAVQTATGERSRLMLDVAGHRAERRTALVALARVAISEVKESGAQKALENMTAFERKVIHDEVAAAGLGSESEGVEPNRHIVILPV